MLPRAMARAGHLHRVRDLAGAAGSCASGTSSAFWFVDWLSHVIGLLITLLDENLVRMFKEELVRMFKEELVPRLTMLLSDFTHMSFERKFQPMISAYYGRVLAKSLPFKVELPRMSYDEERPLMNPVQLPYLLAVLKETLRNQVQLPYERPAYFSMWSEDSWKITRLYMDHWLSKDYFNEGTNDIAFSVSSSGNGGIEIELDSITMHIPKHCSVHHPVVQMLLFATVSFRGTFHCPSCVVPKSILDIKKSSSADVPTVYEAGWVPVKRDKRHSVPSPGEGAISYARGKKVDFLDRSESLSVLFDVSRKKETLISELPRSNKTQRDGSTDSAGIVCGSMRLSCGYDGLDDSTWIEEAEKQRCILKNQETYALVTTQSLTLGDGSSSSTDTLDPLLLLDSGAGHHAVGDARILCNAQDPPSRRAVIAADGARLPVTRIGDIQTPRIKIQDVYLVPGLEVNLIGVRQLARSKIVTTFYENHAELWCEGERVGGAIADNATSLYRLYFLNANANGAVTMSQYATRHV